MIFLNTNTKKHEDSPELSKAEVAQDSYSQQGILRDLSVCKDDEAVPLSTDRQSELALIYGGAISSVQSPSPSQTTTVEEQGKSSETNSSLSRSSTWSTSVQTLLDQPPSTLPQWLVLGGIAFCFAFGAWATFGQIDEVGHAQGRLVPKGETYKIDPLEMGKVANIAVKEGQSVKAGQVLVELDTQIATGEVERLQQMLSASEIELTQKQTLLAKAHLEGRTRSQIAQATIQSQKAALIQANEKIAATRKLLSENQTMVAALQERIEHVKPLTETAQQLLKQKQVDWVAQKERLDRLAPLLKDGAISKEVVYQAEQNLRDRQSAIIQSQLGETASTREQVFQAEQSLRDCQSSITQNQGELQQAIAEAARLQAELTQREAEGRKIQLESQQQIQQLEVDITQLKGKIADTQNLLTSAKTKLNQRFLYASVNGVISSLNVRNKGEVVQPGQTVAELAPQGSPLELSAVLPNREAGFVKVGMPVQIKLDAYPYQDYGIIHGKVKSISADAKPDEKLGPVYRVTVELDRNYVTDEHKRIQFKAGQTASADIVIRRRRIADMLLDPIRQLKKGGINL
ncbi:MAG TPA: HlyD family efflux transporter periplasmic adaptor subunit [Stenomitos sp.]